MTRAEIERVYRECGEEIARYSDDGGRYDAYSFGWKVACAELFADLPAGRALVVGCKHGTECVFLSRLGWEVVGLDIRARVPGEARERHRFALIIADLEDPRTRRLDLGRFDLVLCSEVLEHLAFCPEAPLRWLRKQLAGGGRFVLSTPDAATYPPVPVGFATRRACQWREIPGFIPGLLRDVSEHSKLYTEEELRDLLAGTGFSILSLTCVSAQGDHLLALTKGVSTDGV